MCDSGHEVSSKAGSNGTGTLIKADVSDLDSYASFLVGEEGIRRTAVGFIGYNFAQTGKRVLIAVDSQYDLRIPEAIARALRDVNGAKADIIVVDIGPDREFGDLDEIEVIMRRESYRIKPRRYEGFAWVEEMALANGYDMLIHGRGGGPGADPRIKNYEFIPWQTEEQFTSTATTFPRELHTLINRKAWELIWNHGPGGTVHLTDPEGTDITYTLWPEYFERPNSPFKESPLWGHLMAHPMPPLVNLADATGILAGTTNHFGRPYPNMKLNMVDGCLESIQGGGAYGDGWNELLEESRHSQYPCFPREGLFWLWEVAIGTNPKIMRPHGINLQSSGGSEWERRRSGVIHLGLGTSWRDEFEDWAVERSMLYGHLHVHLLFPTLDITTRSGEVLRVIDRGHLTALDDPDVRKLAGKFGDPDLLLKEDWVPKVPGISIDGSYEEYSKNPVPWVYGDIGS